MKTLWGVEESTHSNQYQGNECKQELTWESEGQESVTSFMVYACACLTHLRERLTFPAMCLCCTIQDFGRQIFTEDPAYTPGFQNIHSGSCFHLTWEESTFLIVTNELLSLSVF